MTQPSYEPPQYGQQQPPPYGGQPEYGQPQQPAYGQQQSPYAQPQYDQPQYGTPASDATQALPQYGYGQQPTSGAPQYGQPISGAPQYGGYGVPGRPVPSGKTNGFAIASLIFGILGGGFVLSIIFAFVALSQIKKRGDKGKGLAIGGLVASGAWLVLGCVIGIVVIIAANSDTPTTDPLADVRKVNSLTVGQCVNGIKESGTTLRSMPVVACTVAHEGEVVSKFNLTGSSYPGDSEIMKLVEEKCFAELHKYSPSTKDDQTINIYYLHPTPTTWTSGDRGVICMATFEDGPRTGSLKD